ncbi:MAG: ATPase, T2SS/T4P/T4SS family [Thermodesulfobacteriota bacterium]
MKEEGGRETARIETRMKEAEVYYSMGLLDEALSAYEVILSEVSEADEEARKSIEDRLRDLREEMESEGDIPSTSDFSSRDLTFLRQTFAADEDNTAILESANAFQELGLFSEAISEWEKLLNRGYPLDQVIAGIMECLGRSKSPAKIVGQLEGILKSKNLEAKARARIKTEIALVMEKRGQEDSALSLYQEAAKLDPGNKEILKKLESAKTGVIIGSRYDHLLQQHLVTPARLQQALSLSKKSRKSVEQILVENFEISKQEIGKSLSLFYGCAFRNFDADLPVPVELIRNLKKAFLLQDAWVPISWDKDGVEILIEDPNDLTKTDHIRALVRAKKLIFSVGIREDIEAYIRAFFEHRTDSGKEEGATGFAGDYFEMPDISFEEEEDTGEVDEDYDEASGQVVKLVDQILVAAYRKNSSDIHIEPSPVTKATTIRFRLDGVCQEYLQVPNSMAKAIISRIKIMSNLDISERRLPQDGKIKFKRKGISPFELRVATLPTAGGFEDAVLRILSGSGAIKLADMGLTERNLRIMNRIITQPYGLVLVVGPTGSGKTTSLHACLGHINKPGIKIWTAEDPIEITQQGLRQVEVKPKIGLSFPRIMRAFLRADPDVIMIGEMRDQETASIGIEASLTGHLVFSTLHTNSASETVTRLLDMGLNPLNFSDAFLGVLAQRLVRMLCTKCREPFQPSQEEFDELVMEYGEHAGEDTGIKLSPHLTLYRPKGCEACSGTGYRGRLGIHELLDGTAGIKYMIKHQANTEDLFKQGKKEGMTTLKQDGIQKVFQGLTDITEVRRVCIE